jgi:predicted GTPase
MSIWFLIFTHSTQIVNVSHQIPQQESQDSSVADPIFLLVDYPGYGDNGGRDQDVGFTAQKKDAK